MKSNFLKSFYVYFILFFVASVAEARDLLLISIDGFHPSYLSQENSPQLWNFASEGVRAKSMKPIYPSLTFPNHFTLVTGLYSENHGIVGNEIRDPNIPERFSLGAPSEVVNDPRWWLGEPIWVTAQKQGLKSGTLFWPGSEAPIQNILPTYNLHFDQSMTNTARVEKLLSWMDLPTEQRPQFYTLYFDTVDTAGHRYGPGSAELLDAIKEVDQNLGKLFTALRDRGIYDEMNILIVSDHGMALFDPDKAINISDVLAHYPNVDRIGGSALASFFSNDADEISDLELALKEKSDLYTVYRKNKIPKRFHYSKSNRIPDLLLVAKEGVAISIKPSFAPTTRAAYKATHGYDNNLASMQASFMARGPDFSSGVVVKSFDNIHLYSLMCKLLRINPAPNDGSFNKVSFLMKKKTRQINN